MMSVNGVIQKFQAAHPELSDEELAQALSLFFKHFEQALSNDGELEKLKITVTAPKRKISKLAAILKKIREDRKFTQLTVSTGMEWERSKIIRIENGQSGISIVHLKALLAFYKVPESEWTDLIEIAREQRKRK